MSFDLKIAAISPTALTLFFGAEGVAAPNPASYIYGQFPLGSAAIPSIQFGATNTGFHASSTTNIAVDFLGVRAFFFVQGDSFNPTAQGSGDIGTNTFSWRRLFVDYTNTGTVGAVTIGKAAGRVNIAAAGTSVVVTNGLCTANAHVFLNIQTVDATAKSAIATCAAGSFTITLNAAATGQVAIDFFMVNAD